MTEADRIDPNEVIIPPAQARQRGLTSTVCFPVGNLCPEGSVIKATAIDPSVVDSDGVYRKTGPARVFTSERDAIASIKGQSDRPLKPGDILVLIARGPMGTGMEETYQITSALKFLKWGREVAVLTDARFSGVSTGACIGHVGPEALAGGPIGRVRDGDHIRIIVDRNRLTGSVDLVGDESRSWSPEEGAEILAAREPTLPASFRFACEYRPSFLPLYLAHLRSRGVKAPPALAGLVRCYRGDRLAGGRGEVLYGPGT